MHSKANSWREKFTRQLFVHFYTVQKDVTIVGANQHCHSFFPTKINILISLYVCFFNNCPFPSMLVLLTLIILKLLNIFFPIFVNMCSLFLCLYLSNLYKCPSFSFSLSRLYLSLYLSARLPVYTAKETFYQPKSIS